MAKKEIIDEQPPKVVEKVDDRTPQQRLKADWPEVHTEIGRYITELGAIRTGLKPSEINKAESIRKGYGF